MNANASGGNVAVISGVSFGTSMRHKLPVRNRKREPCLQIDNRRDCPSDDVFSGHSS